jgi:serine/threonine-protein kinase
MEYVDGLTLGEMMDEYEGGRIDPKRAVNIFIQVAAALDHGFRSDIIHREVRPDCVMITEGDQAKLEGLGLTKDENTRFLQGENAYYVAPEQCRGNEPDTRSDVYSLGCCLFHCLAGEPPFQGGSPKDVLGRRLVSDPPYLADVNPNIPQDLADICNRMMARDPGQRYQSPAEVMDALKQVSFGPPPGDGGAPVARTGRRVPTRPSGRLRRGRSARSSGRRPRRRRFRR